MRSPFNQFRLLGSVTVHTVVLYAVVSAGEKSQRIEFTDRLPYGQSPIDYASERNSDPITKLNRRLLNGDLKLQFKEGTGYLRSVLKALDVPVESQLLVYSKTALNPTLVTPKTPRAVYFNDEISVGWVPGTKALEIMAMDPLKGASFYLLDQRDDKPPRLVRQTGCLACHAGTTTVQVPGWMVRSFLVTDNGKPVSGYSRITHQTDFRKRFGGWYVTGTHGKQTHHGNVVGEKQNYRLRTEPQFAGNCTDLSKLVNVKPYLTPHSDLIAHLVLNHQSHGLNLITRVGYEARLGRRSDAEDRLLRYLLFVDEAPLAEPVKGTSGYRQWFERRGPFDSQGRSLRQFDLQTRLFKYRLSYLIYSRAFDGLPAEVKSRIYRRLWEVLNARKPPSPFDKLPNEERREIREILMETKDGLPKYWGSK